MKLSGGAPTGAKLRWEFSAIRLPFWPFRFPAILDCGRVVGNTETGKNLISMSAWPMTRSGPTFAVDADSRELAQLALARADLIITIVRRLLTTPTTQFHHSHRRVM
jgi:hypothetical protein